MIKWTLLITLIASSAKVFAADNYYYPQPEESKGVHWYNDPIKIEEQTQNPPRVNKNYNSLTQQNAEQKLSELQKELNQLKALAVLKPTIDNVTRYKKAQDNIMELASVFSMQWKKALLINPELDYGLRYSHYNGMAGTISKQDAQTRLQAIQQLTQKYGVFFFYRGNNEIDKQFAAVVKKFSLTHNVPIVALSIDKEISPYFPLTQKDNGIVQRLNIHYFPALLLVEPKRGVVKPVSYGFLPLLDLERRFLNVATDFTPNF